MLRPMNSHHSFLLFFLEDTHELSEMVSKSIKKEAYS